MFVTVWLLQLLASAPYYSSNRCFILLERLLAEKNRTEDSLCSNNFYAEHGRSQPDKMHCVAEGRIRRRPVSNYLSAFFLLTRY